MKTILVVDDDKAIVSSIAKVLTSNGYKASICTNALAGLEQARQMRPDLILCDVVMPDMSGYEFLETLRHDLGDNTPPLMFLTCKSSKRDVLEGIDLGADNYLSKPIDFELLLATVAARFADMETDSIPETTNHPHVNINPALEASYTGWWAAVEPNSHRCFLGKTREMAYQSALRAYPSGVFLYRKLENTSREYEMSA